MCRKGQNAKKRSQEMLVYVLTGPSSFKKKCITEILNIFTDFSRHCICLQAQVYKLGI